MYGAAFIFKWSSIVQVFEQRNQKKVHFSLMSREKIR